MKGARFLVGAILFGLLLFPGASISGQEEAALIVTGRVVEKGCCQGTGGPERGVGLLVAGWVFREESLKAL